MTYIKKESLYELLENFERLYPKAAAAFRVAVAEMPEGLVRRGEWTFKVSSFCFDAFNESAGLCIYITAHCSECGCKHPNNHAIQSVSLYAPEDAEDGFKFDRVAEEEKVLGTFDAKWYTFANYCPNCGAKMEVGRYA